MSDPVTPLTPAQTAAAEKRAGKESYVKRVLVTLDQSANVFLGGHPGETISARAGRAALAGKLWGKVLCRALNLVQPNHDAKAMAGDVERAKQVIEAEKQSGGIDAT